MKRSDFIWVLLPIAPLILGFLALGVVDGGMAVLTDHLPGKEALFPDGREMRFFNAFIIFVGVGVFHVAVCIAVAAMMLWHMWRLPDDVRNRALMIFAAAIGLLVVANGLVRTEGNGGALTLAYRNICTVIRSADVFVHLMPPTCTSPGISTFAWMALLPYIFGVIAAASAAALVSTAYRPLPADDPQAALAQRAKMVDMAFKATAFVLVTSTITMMQFYNLPFAILAETIGDNPNPAIPLMTGYAHGMAFFWGVLFTLTLIAIFGPGNIMLGRQLRARNITDVPEALSSETTRKQLANILTTLAPLLIGASGSILETIAGSL